MSPSRPPTERNGRSQSHGYGKSPFAKRGKTGPAQSRKPADGDRRDRQRPDRASADEAGSRPARRPDPSLRPRRETAEQPRQSERGPARPARGDGKKPRREGRPAARRDDYRPDRPRTDGRDRPAAARPAYAGARAGGTRAHGRPERPTSRDRPARDHQARGAQTRDRAPRERGAEAKAPVPRDTRDSVLIWGVHAVREAWLNPKRRCFRLRATASAQAAFAAPLTQAQDALLKRPDPGTVERAELDRMTPPGSVHQGIVLEAAPLAEPALRDIIMGDRPPDLILMLDQVTDPHNVGAILRSAAAFGAGAVIMTERNAPGSTGVLAKSASGALEHVPMIHVVNLARALDELKQAGYWSVGLAEQATHTLDALDLTGRTVIVLGAEGEGLRHLTRQKCDELARLPSGGPIGSLNVSNAAAIGLYEVRRQKSA